MADSAAAPPAKPRRLIARSAAFLRSRTFWFLLERVVSNGCGFVLIAVLTRIASMTRLAEFISVYAFASLFLPLFTSAVLGYVVRLIGHAESAEEEGQIVRSSFFVMQAASVVLVAALILLEYATGDGSLLSALILLSILFSPLTLFAATLRARDDYVYFIAVTVAVQLVGTVIRVAVLVTTRNLELVALLLSLGPLIGGPLYLLRSGVRMRAWPWISPSVCRLLLRETPTLMGAMLLAMLFWRGPILIAQWRLTPTDVVHIALCMQLVTGLCIAPNALCESLFGPLALARADRDDARFRQVLRVGSGIAWICGIGAVAGVAVLGEPVLRLAFGAKAEGAGAYCLWLSLMCLGSGLNRMTNSVVVLQGRPAERVLGWLVSLTGLALATAALFRWPDIWIIVVATPVSMLLGSAVMPFMLPDLRRYAGDLVAGARLLLVSPQLWRDSARLMLKS
jgi:O-antigen/teichoic acid export membrane protein